MTTWQEKLETRQYREMKPLEIRTEKEDEQNYIVEGYAMKYEPYKLYETEDGEVNEEFKREAFDESDFSDVIFLYDHQGKVLARGSNGTLEITLDGIGMHIKADLSKSKASREMYEEIQAGLVNKMSWGFKPGDYEFDQKTRTIVHNKINKIYDVSAVGIPANNETMIYARKFVDGVIDEFEAERLKEQKKRKKVMLKIKIEKERDL